MATSTSHAETSAHFHAVKECIDAKSLIKHWICGNGKNACEQNTKVHGLSKFKAFEDLTPSIAGATTIFGDNSACIELVKRTNPDYHRTKHWQMNWNWLHEQRDALKTFTPVHVKTTENLADGFTKPLGRFAHNQWVKELRLCDQ